MLKVSQSSATRYLGCEQSYYYADVRRLVRRDRSVAPELGTFLHEYFGGYYKGLQQGLDATQAHRAGVLAMSAIVGKLKGYINMATALGMTDLVLGLSAIPKRAYEISTRYFKYRGRFDAEIYEVLIVEKKLRVTLREGITSSAILDLVTRTRSDGTVHLWEHKSSENLPPSGVRLWDLQTTLYAAVLETVLGIKPSGVLWNQIYTKTPTVPKLLKRGGLSKDQDINTTWDVYAAAVTANGLDLQDYEEMRERLQGREFSVFFPRFEQHMRAEPGIVLRDYVATAIEIEQKRAAWTAGTAFPIRTLSKSCQYCNFAMLCRTALTGGEEEDVIRLRYITDITEEVEGTPNDAADQDDVATAGVAVGTSAT